MQQCAAKPIWRVTGELPKGRKWEVHLETWDAALAWANTFFVGEFFDVKIECNNGEEQDRDSDIISASRTV